MLKRLAIISIAGILGFFVSQAYANVVVVPCPNALVDSSGNILAALHEARNGGTVQLQEGAYFLFNTVVVDFAFKGVLRGAGKDKTVITTDPDHPIDRVSLPLSTSYSEDDWLLFWFNIPVGAQGSVAMSDLSISVPYAEVTSADDKGLTSFVVVNGTKVDTSFDRMRIKGAPGMNGWEFNNWLGIWIFSLSGQDPMTGNHYLRNCEFDAAPISYGPDHIQNGTLKATNNSLNNVFFGLIYEGLSNCTVEISRNQFTNVKWNHAIGAISYSGLPDYPVAPQPSRYVITYNSIQANGYADGIWIEDQFADDPSPEKKIKNPYVAFNSIGGESMGFGIVTWNVNRATIAANKLYGNGFVGVNLFGTTNTLVAGDSVEKFTPIPWVPTDWFPWLPLPPGEEITSAQIMLWADTSHCTVIGADLTDTVMDQGTDNTLINVDVKPFQWLGQASHDSMKGKLELRKQHRPLWAR